MKTDLKKILVIQNAFIGDAILGTSVLEKLHATYPNAKIDYLVRKDASSLFEKHPFINDVLIFDRKNGKWKELFRLKKFIRKNKYDLAVTLQRFGSSGFLIWRSGAKIKAGFSNNPFSFSFHRKIKHEIGNGKHEIQRNNDLISPYVNDSVPASPKLYPHSDSEKMVEQYASKNFITVSPGSVWFTKQWPKEKWIELLKSVPETYTVYLLGGKSERELCEKIKTNAQHKHAINLAGELPFLASAALMAKAKMNFTNDSAPLHLCSAMHAPLTAVFCSTVPEFGFGPVHSNGKIIQVSEKLECRPCGIHGHRECPKGHFKCALSINPVDLLHNL